MKHNYLNNTEINEAKEKYFSVVRDSGFSYKTEYIPSAESYGRITAEAVYAKICSPHYNASAMDGIAVRAEMTYGAREGEPLYLSPEEYTVVDTGDPMPKGTDSVIMAEDVTEAEGGKVKIISAVHPWQNVRQIGEDICMGDMIAVRGTRITPALCGAFLAGGVTKVKVIKKPLVGIIPTGDEIVPPTENPGEGDIIEFNSAIFSSYLKEWDADSKIYPIVKDKKEKLSAALEKALGECDIVLMLAGSSAGRDDYTSQIISSHGKTVIHGIAAKPGKPAILGICGDTPVAGLPGYPISATVVMEEFVKDIIDMYYMRQNFDFETVEAVLGSRIVSSLKYREYIRVSLGKRDGEYFAMPLSGGAGVITSLTKASGILEIPQNSEGIEKGEKVRVRLLKSRNEIDNALIITGSHDPVIDEIGDIIKEHGCGFSVFSAHAGSMGAINAVKSGQAHLGAVHLLDEKTGEYNKSYIEKYFPDGSSVLIKGIGRVQGFMVKKGNPLNIKDFSDIKNVRYVNRQRGAGTRILCDCLMKKYGIAPDNIDGYGNEKYTHTAVAAFIASGSADAGLGIFSAAKMYGLDFIPVCNEEYDFLVDGKYLDDPRVRIFFEILRSEELKKRLTDAGGYSF